MVVNLWNNKCIVILIHLYKKQHLHTKFRVKLNLNCNHDMFTSKEGDDKNFDTTIQIMNVLYVKKWNYSLSVKIF